MLNVSCDICRCDDAEPLSDQGRGGEDISVVICKRCGLVYLNPRDDDAQVEAHYKEGGFSLQARGGAVPSRKKTEDSEEMALRRFKILSKVSGIVLERPGKCLEIGCGIGSFLRLMRGAGWEGRGLEPDHGYASFGTKLYNIRIDTQFYEEVVWDDGRFDLIVAFHVLEHSKSPRRFLEKIYSELNDRGKLYLEVPTIEKPYGGDLEKFFWTSHLYYFSRNTLTGLLENVGFRVVKNGYSGDFLWVVAQKSGLPHYSEGIPLPLDKVSEILVSVRNAHEGFKRKDPILRRLYCRACRKIKKNLSKIREAVFILAAAVGGKGDQRRFIVHVGLHHPCNAGDTLLFAAVRRLLSLKYKGSWRLEPLWEEITDRKVNNWNRWGRAIVVGGGGLFLQDTNTNSQSGWQWPCSVDSLKEIRLPLILFAVGYNRFRGQDDFGEIFKKNIGQIVDSARFIGLRNYGSIQALSGYLPKHLSAKLQFQPCPTTLLKYFYPDAVKGQVLNCKRIGLNVAFDRHDLRFQKRENQILNSIADTMKWAQDAGWNIDLVMHMPLDETISPWLLKKGVDFRTVNLFGVQEKRIVEYYRDIPLVIGMRGHAQMIPFGLGNAIISLISHEKLSWFLDDIQHPEWGVEITEKGLGEILKNKIDWIGGNLPRVRAEIYEVQEKLWEISQANLKKIGELIL